MITLSRLTRQSISIFGARRRYATQSALPVSQDSKPAGKREGTIMDVFGSLSEEAVLPPRFAALKKHICSDSARMVTGWREVLRELEPTVKEVSNRGADIVPQIQYTDIARGLPEDQKGAIKKTGVVIVRGAVSEEEALSWKQSIKDYIALNREHVKGGPPGNIVFYEIYNSLGQIRARTHPAIVETQRALLSLWHASPAQDVHDSVSLDTPISYFDRLRIRPPGPSAFVLGPHIDGGGVERWEDPGFRNVFGKILPSQSNHEGWRAHDPFDVTPRLHAKQDLYNAPNQCTVFRPWQGWTSLSHTSAGEGTLRVLPFLKLSTAYIMLRPFFRPIAGTSSLAAEDWELDLDGTTFPGSAPGKTQELSSASHPHFMLDRTMVSIPHVAPGDQVYWHCDLVHAVEGDHNGQRDSSVLYIPAVPLTEPNAEYLKTQSLAFKDGRPAPDFPGGQGESLFTGRATAADISREERRRLLGLEPLQIPADADKTEVDLIRAADTTITS